MSNSRIKPSLEDFKLFYEELVFTTGPKRPVNRVRRNRKTAAASS